VHLVGVIMRIYHDARSPERQKRRLVIGKLGTMVCPPPPIETKGHSRVPVSPRC